MKFLELDLDRAEDEFASLKEDCVQLETEQDNLTRENNKLQRTLKTLQRKHWIDIPVITNRYKVKSM